MNNDTYRYPVALTIAGSDSSGGAGIQADLKTFSALGVYGASAITAITAQNTQGIYGIQAISPDITKGQIDAVMGDLDVDAIKIGMLHNADTAAAVAGSIRNASSIHTILDPVMISSTGKRLMEDKAIDIIVNRLFPQITLLTPNTDEAGYLAGITIQTEDDMQKAAHCLQAMGCHSVLIKGGHLQGQTTTDILYTRGLPPLRFEAPTVQTINTHGTGCTLSSAITANMALGYDLANAVRLAKEYVTGALAEGANVRIGHGHGAMNHLFSPVPLKKIRIEL